MGSDRNRVHHVLELQGGVGFGGSERHTLQLALGLRSRPDVAVSVVGPFGNRPDMHQELSEAGIPLYELDLVRAREVPRTVWRLVRLVRHHHVDLIHSHLRNADLLGLLAGIITRTPVVVTLHGRTGPRWGDRVSLRSRLVKRIHRILLRRSRRVIAVSHEVADVSVTDLRLDRSQITVIANGTEVDDIASDPDAGAGLRSALGASADAPLVAIVGDLSRQKGIDHFLRMARIVHDERPATRFVVVGEGPQENELRAFAVTLGLDGVVVFTGGRTDVPAILLAADVAVTTARDEGFGRAVLEAMAAATPVVAFASGAIPEIVVDGESGRLVDHGDVAALAREVDALLDDPGLRRRLGEAGRRRVERDFSVDRFVDRTAAVLVQIASEPSRRRGPAGDRRVEFTGPRRVLYLDHAPVWGGAEAALLRLVEGLDRERFAPLVATPAGSLLVGTLRSRELPAVVVPFERLERPSPTGVVGLVRSVGTVARLARRERVDLVHSNTVRTHVVGALAGLVVRRPVVWTLHDATFPGWAYRPLSEIPARIIFVSDWLAAHYSTKRTASRAVIIPNGLPSTDEPRPAGPSRRAWVREELGIPAEAPLVLHVGRLVPSKGADVFVTAARAVLEVVGDAHFVVVGGAEDDPRSTEHAARLAAAVRGIGDHVHLVGHRDDVERFLADADLLAYTSVEREGLPTVLLEAMHHGVAVIASAVGGAVELVEHGVTGLLVPAADELLLADAVIRLALDAEQRERLGAAGRERVRTEHALDRQIRRVEALYSEVLDGT